MHESGVGEAILDAALLRAHGRPVREIRVRVGASLGAVPGALGQSFEIAALGTCAEGASLDVVAVPGDELTLESLRYKE